MSKAEERGKTYALHKASEKLHDYYGNAMLSVVQFDGHDINNAYEEGYHQAEKDLELTWEDIEQIQEIANSYTKHHSMEPRIFVYKEVLNRFNKQKENGKVQNRT